MNWRYIMDEQPCDGQMIVQVDAPYEQHYTMGMRKYFQKCSFEEVLNFCKRTNLPNPDFWWIPASEFSFPKHKEEK